MAAAKREVWTGAQLRRLLVERSNTELSAASVSALMTKTPRQLKLSTLAALCTALDCQPSELIEVDTTPVAQTPAAAPEAPQKRRSGGGRRTPPPF
jgi:DNA-binding Xre family transcriptional regulator